MPGRSVARTMVARFDGDTRGLARATDGAEAKLRSFQRQAERTGTNASTKLGGSVKGLTSGLGGIATKAGVAGLAIGAVTGVVTGAKAALDGMIDSGLQLQLGAVKASRVFGSSYAQVEAWAKRGANAMGLTSREAIALTANLGDFLVPMGFARGQAADLSMQFGNLAGSLALWSGGQETAASVMDIFQSALTGEFDSLQRLGVNINAAKVKQAALDIQKKSSTKITDDQAQALAILRITQKSTTDAQNNAKSTEVAQAKRVATLRARFREQWQEIQVKLLPVLTDLYEKVGTKVLPLLEKFAKWLGSEQGQQSLAKWAGRVDDTAQAVGYLIDKISSAIGWVDDLSRKLSGSDFGKGLSVLNGWSFSNGMPAGSWVSSAAGLQAAGMAGGMPSASFGLDTHVTVSLGGAALDARIDARVAARDRSTASAILRGRRR